jgi:hypothetical protein
MLVYGDPQFETRLSWLVDVLRHRLSRASADDLENWRTLLIHAGQLEQGTSDLELKFSPAKDELSRRCARLTDRLASHFVRLWRRSDGSSVAGVSSDGQGLTDALAAICDGPWPHDPSLKIKIPEGFAFYCLFPEQYCLAARRWAEQHQNDRPKQAFVVGVRSIGTTLSAVVQATIAQTGWQTARCTVRPTGHPFDRHVCLPEINWRQYPCALVVDEGPGISGSSMAAAARALRAEGVTNISFLPGHAGEPGSAASAEVRQCWQETPRHIAQLNELQWDGLTLQTALELRSREITASEDGFEPAMRAPQDETVEDLSAGQWRSRVFTGELGWPGVASLLERTKLRCATAGRPALLWKYAGLGCCLSDGHTPLERLQQRVAVLAAEGWTCPVLGSAHGFAAMPWVEGRCLTAADAQDPKVVARLGDYLARAPGPPLSAKANRLAWERLTEVLYWNAREALGEEAAEQCRSSVCALEPPAGLPTAGDGHLAPWEWIRTRDGRLIKTDAGGHDCDHTLVGAQPVLWDIAGAMVEWGLEPPQTERLLAPWRHRGLTICSATLRFHEMAYAAFRVGLCALFAAQAGPGAERARLERDLGRYRSRLSELAWRA